MPTFQKFNALSEHLAKGIHQVGTHVFKIYLTNTAPNASTMTVKGDLAAISGGGYADQTVTLSVSRSGAISTIIPAGNATFTATGAMGPFRYAVLFNDTPTSPADPLMGWWDYGSSQSAAINDNVIVDLDETNGIFTIA